MNEIPSCWYCGGCVDEADHQQPKSKGGSDDPSNLVDSCTPCNIIKNNRTLEEFRALVAARNGMRVEDVRFHGEGGRTFKRLRRRERAPAATDVREYVTNLVERSGSIVEAAAALGVGREVVIRIVGGLGVQVGTIALVREKMK